MIELSIVRKKQVTIKCDKSTVKSNVDIAQCNNGTVIFENKKQGTTECDKNRVRCDVGIAQCDNRTIKFEKKIKEPLYVTKELSNLILELHNVIMEPSNLINK